MASTKNSLVEKLQQAIQEDTTVEQFKGFLADFVPEESQAKLLTTQANATDLLPIHRCAAKGNLELLKYLVSEFELDPLSPDETGLTTLHVAAVSGKERVMAYLVEELELDASMTDNSGRTVAHYGAIGGSVPVLEQLEQYNVIDRVSVKPLNPLVQDIDLLLGDSFGTQQLHHFLTENKQAHILDFYLEANKFAELFARGPSKKRNAGGSSSASSSSSSSSSSGSTSGGASAGKAVYNEESVELAQNMVAKFITAANNRKLQIRIGHTKQKEVVKQMEKITDVQNRKATKDSVDFEPAEMFVELAQECKLQIRDEYLEEFAKSNYAIPLRTYDNCPKFCTLGLAAKYGNVDAVQYLITTTGIDPNEADVTGTTALHHAAWRQDTVILGLLLESGANPNVQDRSGNTALHVAVFHCNKQMVSDLIRKGARNFPNKRNQNPVDLAKDEDIAIFIRKSLEQKKRR